jgi:DsbC/DsbD-like thiol-disulfide interchange protein
VFPIEVLIAQPGQPSHLRLRLRYGVCADGCLGDEVALDLPVSAGPGARTAGADLIDAAMARLPVDAMTGGMTVHDVRVVDAGRGVVVSLDTQVPFRAPDLLLETDQGHEFSAPAVTVRDGGHAVTFRVAVRRGKAPPLSPGTPVTLTVLGGPRAVEVTGLVASP